MRRIDLFKLHDENDRPKGLIVAYGGYLKEEIKRMIEEIDNRGISKTKLVKHIMNKLNVSITTAERLVYLERACEYIKRKWFPLVFIEELIKLSGDKNCLKIQDKIEYIRIGNSSSKPIRPAKYLTKTLCKIAGAHAADGTLFNNKPYGILIRIVDQYESNIRAYSKWIFEAFAIKLKPQKSKFAKDMWEIGFKNKTIGRYLNKILGFRYGCKVYDVKEPEMIKNSTLENRKAFALGFLTFEGGIGVKTQIELCARSKRMIDDIFETLEMSGLDIVKMKKQSYGMMWRLWSKRLPKDEAVKWLEFFEPKTEKWFKLYEHVNGFQGKTNNFKNALKTLSTIFPSQSASKTSMAEVLNIVKRNKVSWRYKIEKETKLKSKWAHSLCHYIRLLEMANAIKIEKRKFGKKKSFGSIVRDVYIYNPDISTWRVPYRPWLENQVRYVS